MTKEATYDEKTRSYYKNLGFKIGKVQTRNLFTRKAADYLGFADFLAIDGEMVIAIQSTSIGKRKKHIDAYRANEEIKDSIRTFCKPLNCDAILICWRKKKKRRGGVQFRYEAQVESLLTLIEE